MQDANISLYSSDSQIDMASFNEGRAPQSADKIAIDRMHADNVGVSIGDGITVGGREYEIVGLLSYVNYLTIHESNTDLMFDVFIFAITISNTIDREASVIGILRVCLPAIRYEAIRR